MCWGKSVITIPHVFELIFRFLDSKDLITASEVCLQWEAAIFGSRQLSEKLGWNILNPCHSKMRKKSRLWSATHRILRIVGLRKKDHYSTQQLIDMKQVMASSRLLNGVVVAPRGKYSGDWSNMMKVLLQINRKYPICWIRIDGTYDQRLISPYSLLRFGSILCHLRHLELTMTIQSFHKPNWILAFEQFSYLESLVLNNGHVRVLKSIRKCCHRLKKLVLKRFACNLPLDDLLNFAELEELIIENLNSFPWFVGESQIELPKLRSLTICMNVNKIDIEELNVPPVTIKAPLLEKAHFSDMLHHVVQLESVDNLRKFTLNVVSSPRSFLSPRMFHGHLRNVTEVIIETHFLKGYQLVIALVWMKHQCPRATRLVFVQQKEPPLKKLRSFAAMEIPNLKQIVHRRPATKAKH